MCDTDHTQIPHRCSVPENNSFIKNTVWFTTHKQYWTSLTWELQSYELFTTWANSSQILCNSFGNTYTHLFHHLCDNCQVNTVVVLQMTQKSAKVWQNLIMFITYRSVSSKSEHISTTVCDTGAQLCPRWKQYSKIIILQVSILWAQKCNG